MIAPQAPITRGMLLISTKAGFVTKDLVARLEQVGVPVHMLQVGLL